MILLMKKYFAIAIIISSVFCLSQPTVVFAGTASVKVQMAAVKKVVVKPKIKPITISDLLGRLVLQRESDYKLWYIEPVSKERYYIHNNEELQEIIAKFSITSPTADFKKMAKNKKSKTPASLIKKYAGRIIVDPANKTKVYYFNPGDNIIYAIESYAEFYRVARVIGLSATDATLRLSAMNKVQETYDPAFYGVAYVRYDGTDYSGGSESQRLLPLASLSKIMTALVLSELDIDWSKIVEITPEEIKYPCTLQACGSTSEIDLRVGDKIRMGDLWVAMLVASSNQSAVILADNSGLSREEFINKMNDRAKSLGLVKTKFVEMSGLSPDNVSTAEEFAKITKAAFDKNIINWASRQDNYVFTVEQANSSPRYVKVLNRNYSLMALGPDAAKTGYLVEAQRNAAVSKNGDVAIALHCYSLTQRNDIIKRLLDGSALSLAN
jgi:hypothetical protein